MRTKQICEIHWVCAVRCWLAYVLLLFGVASDDMGILKCACSPMLTYQNERRGKVPAKKKKTNRNFFIHDWRRFHEMNWTIFVRRCHIPYHKASGVNRHTTSHSLIWMGAAELIFEVDIERISRKSSFLSIGDGVPLGNTTHITQCSACKVRTRFVKFWVAHAVVLVLLLLDILLASIARIHWATPTTIIGGEPNTVTWIRSFFVSHNTLHFMRIGNR